MVRLTDAPVGKKVNGLNYKMSYWLMRILGIGGIALMLIGGLTNQTSVGGIGIVCVLGGTLQTSFFYRCPHCKRDLPKRSLPKTCPFCKKPLD